MGDHSVAIAMPPRDDTGKGALMDNRLEVAVGAGTMMSGSGAVARFPHRWTVGGLTVEAELTGGHLLHLAAAGCVLNDLYREAATLGIELAGGPGDRGGRVRHCDLAVDRHRVSRRSQLRCPASQPAHLLEVVDQVAEIPRAIRAGSTVRRVS